MRLGAAVLTAAIMLAATPCAAASPAGGIRGVAKAELVAAAKATPLKRIDYGEDLCRNGRSVEVWLRELTGDEARAIRWTGGPCQIVTTLNPIDAGGRWCAQATIRLRHPKNRADQPMVEIFFEAPIHGHPGPAYAFRAEMDEEGMFRFRRDFESAWLERFPATAGAIACPQE